VNFTTSFLKIKSTTFSCI